MKVTKAKAAENRERILAGAARLFREQGVSGVGVDALAEAAGLTHGSLYSQFGSKERLAEAALQHALTTSAARLGDARSLEDYVARYLTADHRDRRGDGCVVAALGSEMPRHAMALRRGFTGAVRAMVGRIAGLLPAGRSSEDAALAAAATMVGALTLARAVDDPALSDRILAAARTALASGDEAAATASRGSTRHGAER
ncbi:TetR/AcrR family transcriptional regulator [Paracraurococcus ruber]|uniref:TetR family transcriptional regulator n=2 Tax=Paracraurococcus ruber TaxID=77675 RepID=A0ABS1D1D6_9PROT|nr:TetR family transcriptional regulator [Paracraurococcus ruber]TDG27484.1 TetR/AcrR family transcriptional regulator [Paracraurococcus ruber]